MLRAGEVLYLPRSACSLCGLLMMLSVRCSYWYHYIVSVDISVQCNTRSGLALRERQFLIDCGFYSE